MLKSSRFVLACIVALVVVGLTAGPALAASTTDALDLTFGGSIPGGSSIVGSVQIPTLAAGAAVTGGGSMSILSGGTILYAGGFNATTVKSMTPASAAAFAPIESVSCSTMVGFFFGLSRFSSCTLANGPVGISGLTGDIQISSVQCTVKSGSTCTQASAPSSQDVILNCPNAGVTLDMGITLTSAISNTAALNLLTPSSGVVITFATMYGTSSGSLC